MKRTVQVKCPECGYINKFSADLSIPGPIVRCCDADEGGCDKNYAVQFEVHAVCLTSKLKMGKRERC